MVSYISEECVVKTQDSCQKSLDILKKEVECRMGVQASSRYQSRSKSSPNVTVEDTDDTIFEQLFASKKKQTKEQALQRDSFILDTQSNAELA
jgi:hypothetical protein